MPSDIPYFDEEHARKCVIAACEARIEAINRANARDRHERRYGMIETRRKKRIKFRNRILSLATGGAL